jgi:hypothetical protein
VEAEVEEQQKEDLRMPMDWSAWRVNPMHNTFHVRRDFVKRPRHVWQRNLEAMENAPWEELDLHLTLLLPLMDIEAQVQVQED